ncbi:retrovirus-related pol polyprotein from transposon TNT 1-94 [Tanacetum coccineum]|uniref:Retrovirus-related pol polyprotein from transposon TNT 1-94 n=1 Tax=Tanacetum coccineum TaxID=301880 RepID=A0ABQ5GK28_9ASTR
MAYSPSLEFFHTATVEALLKPTGQISNVEWSSLSKHYFEGNVTSLGSGYHQKDRKPSQNDKTEHGMEKTVQNQGQSPKMPKSESIQKNQQGTEFLNKTLHAYFKEEGIEHQTSTPRTPEQNGVVERRNHTLVKAARMMLSASKLPLFFWAEAIATACYTQNRSIIIPTHEKGLRITSFNEEL